MNCSIPRRRSRASRAANKAVFGLKRGLPQVRRCSGLQSRCVCALQQPLPAASCPSPAVPLRSEAGPDCLREPYVVEAIREYFASFQLQPQLKRSRFCTDISRERRKLWNVRRFGIPVLYAEEQHLDAARSTAKADDRE